jgi:hypothetical protein
MEALLTKPTSVEDLKVQPSLWYKIHVLVYDLRNFQANSQAEARLAGVEDLSYIGTPYFDPVEVKQLKACVIDATNSTNLEMVIRDSLRERLERRMKKRVESGDYRVCTAHDIAPIFEKAFCINPKELQTNTEFLALLENCQLEPSGIGNWKGLPKKSFKPNNKHKKHKKS